MPDGEGEEHSGYRCWHRLRRDCAIHPLIERMDEDVCQRQQEQLAETPNDEDDACIDQRDQQVTQQRLDAHAEHVRGDDDAVVEDRLHRVAVDECVALGPSRAFDDRTQRWQSPDDGGSDDHAKREPDGGKAVRQGERQRWPTFRQRAREKDGSGAGEAQLGDVIAEIGDGRDAIEVVGLAFRQRASDNDLKDEQ